MTIPIEQEDDLLTCRMLASDFAHKAGFPEDDLIRIATAVSEIVRNVIMYANSKGSLMLQFDGVELTVIVADSGPGIKDVSRAMQDGYSTSGGLGIGIAGAKRLMGEMDISSVPGRGTTITLRKVLHALRGTTRVSPSYVVRT